MALALNSLYLHDVQKVSSGETTFTRDSENESPPLSSLEIDLLRKQGCSAENWSQVRIAETSDLRRVQRVHFSGSVHLGNFDKIKKLPNGLRFATGVYDANLDNVTVGDNALIRNVRQGIRDYDIESDAVIVDVGSIAMRGESSFGNGQMIRVLREDGELAMPIYDCLSSNVTQVFVTGAVGELKKRFRGMVRQYASSVTSSRGLIGRHAIVTGCGQLTDVRIGASARIEGSTALINCSINSLEDSPVTIGHGVKLRDSIVASGSSIDTDAVVNRCFVGEGVRIDRQFSVEDSVLFANSEFSHGEACSLIAGPFTVSHHKSSLMVAAETSFFNAGSGANQCNHAYKTGPVHYGVLGRGCKVGASSCLSWPARAGAFSTVLGRHESGFDAADFPFSYIVESERKTRLVPGLNLIRVGLWRDERKWIDRDRRNNDAPLDRIHFNVLSPWTVQQMCRARDVIDQLLNAADRSNGDVTFAGMQIKHSDLLRGKRLYSDAIRCWLSGMAVAHLEEHWNSDDDLLTLFGLKGDPDDAYDEWCDAGGMFVLRSRIVDLLDNVVNGSLSEIQQLETALGKAYSGYEADSWSWCQLIWRQEFGSDLGSDNSAELVAAIEQWRDLSLRFLDEIVKDAEKDIATATMWTNAPYAAAGSGSTTESCNADHSLLRELSQKRRDIEDRSATLLRRLSFCSVPVAGV